MQGTTKEPTMHRILIFFRTPLIALVWLTFMGAAMTSRTGHVYLPPEEGTPAYLAVQQAQTHDVFSPGDGDAGTQAALSDVDQAREDMRQTNTIVVASF
jgi:hypothetical protein